MMQKYYAASGAGIGPRTRKTHGSSDGSDASPNAGTARAGVAGLQHRRIGRHARSDPGAAPAVVVIDRVVMAV